MTAYVQRKPSVLKWGRPSTSNTRGVVARLVTFLGQAMAVTLVIVSEVGAVNYCGGAYCTSEERCCTNYTCIPRTESCSANPPPPSVHIEAIEFIQAIQSTRNDVVLIAGKPTIARFYVSTQTASPVTITGSVVVTHGNRSATLSPMSAVVVTPEMPIRQRRETLTLSLNFILPSNLIGKGDTVLKLGQIVDAGGNPVTCDNCNLARSATFKQDIPLRIRIVGLRYTTGTMPPVVQEPRDLDFRLLSSWLKRAFPVGTIVSSRTIVDSSNPFPFNCGQANAQLSAMRTQDMANGGDLRTHYIGLVSNVGGFMRGCAGVPSTADPAATAASPTGTTAFNAPVNSGGDIDDSFGDWYGGHELGHTFGRTHPGFCNGNSADDSSFPYPNGQISDNIGTYVGLDFGDPDNRVERRVIPGVTGFDVMTYCDQPQWLSAYTYGGIYERLVAEDAAFGSAPGARMLRTGSPNKTDRTSQRGYVHVVATANMTAQTAKFAHVTPVTRALPQAEHDGRAELLALDRDGTVIGRFPVKVLEDTDIPAGQPQTALIDAVIPYSPSLGELRLLLAGKEVATYRASQVPPAAPTRLTLSRQPTAEATAASPTLTWVPAPSATSDNVTYIVQTSQDGKAWQTIGIGIEQAKLKMTTDSANSRHVRIIATNGFVSSTPAVLTKKR